MQLGMRYRHIRRAASKNETPNIGCSQARSLQFRRILFRDTLLGLVEMVLAFYRYRSCQ